MLSTLDDPVEETSSQSVLDAPVTQTSQQTERLDLLRAHVGEHAVEVLGQFPGGVLEVSVCDVVRQLDEEGRFL